MIWLRHFVVALLVVAALLLSSCIVLSPPAPLAQPEQGFTLTSVMLVVPGEAMVGPVNLTVEGNRIAAVQPAVDGAVSGYVLPALSNAHMHGPSLPFPGENAINAFLHLYHGVTLTRMAAGDAGMRDAIAGGEYAGPKMLTCGPFLDGEPPLWPSSLVVTDRASADRAVSEVASKGFDCIKVYNELSAPASEAIYRAARDYQLPVIGHVPWRQDAAVAWIDDQQHMLGIPVAPGERDEAYSFAMQRMKNVSSQRVELLADALQARQVTLTPTLITLQRKVTWKQRPSDAARENTKLLPHYYRERLWHADKGLVSSRLFDTADIAVFAEVYPIAEQTLLALHKRGVRLHTGTDSPAEAIVPGAGLIEELHLLQGAGLSAEEVLQASTVHTARDLFGDAYGRLAPGAPAEFVVYAENPVEDLKHLALRTAVVSDGRLYKRAMLDAQLARYQQWYDSTAYRHFSGTIVAAGLWLVNLAAD